MLFDLYYKKKLGIPWISILLILTCFAVWVATLTDNNLWVVFATHSHPIYFWQYFSGLFQHSFSPKWFYTIHFVSNISVIVLFGVMIERIIGTKKYLLLNFLSGCIGLIYFFVNRMNHEHSTFNGISVIVWSYAPLALMILLQIYRFNKQVIKEKMFFLMVFELFFMWIFVTIVDFLGSNTSNDNHLVATIVGIVFMIVYKNTTKLSISKVLKSDICCPKCNFKNNGISIGLVSLLPIGVLVVIGMYLTTGLDKMFANVVSISPSSTIEEINNNGSKIEIEFDNAFSEKGITSYSIRISSPTNIDYEIKYSDNRTKAIIAFNTMLPEKTKGKISINRGSFVNNQNLKALEILFE